MAQFTPVHGLSESPTFHTWEGMMARCHNPKNPAFSDYGARGITVCPRWHTFANFLEDMGMRPEGKMLDRINNDDTYNPVNCRWASAREQSRNRRSNVFVEWRGKKKILIEWAEELGLPYKVLHERIRKCGWTIERALSTPVRKRGEIWQR